MTHSFHIFGFFILKNFVKMYVENISQSHALNIRRIYTFCLFCSFFIKTFITKMAMCVCVCDIIYNKLKIKKWANDTYKASII